MTDKIRGVIAILVGVFALYQGYQMYGKPGVESKMWLEVVAGLVLLGLGIWRFQRKPKDPTAELLK
jgi:ABC-type nickel/cobalt efflux system permease component RcnA